jgi:ATP-dependent Clp protease ATP-binding subunit ClpA
MAAGFSRVIEKTAKGKEHNMFRNDGEQITQGPGTCYPAGVPSGRSASASTAKSKAKVSLKLDPTRTGEFAGKLHGDLSRRIVGQEKAVEEVVNIYQMFMTGMSAAGRPIGNFLFLGPTGTGKTRLVEATAESLVGDPRAVIKIDCAEFQHSHEIAKLIGSPPGYLGHRETHPLLSQETLNQYHTEKMRVSFVLFDEIEKASDALWNLLLGVLDKATLTLGDNRRVDFSRAMIFMTSNLGASEMGAMLRPKLGFGAMDALAAGTIDSELNDKVARSGLEAARRKFTPEFMNRLDKVVVFNSLGSAELQKILDIELNMLQQRILASPSTMPFVFRVTNDARNYVLREGTDTKYGARHLKRAIERELVHPLSNLIASDQIRGGDLIRIAWDAEAGRLDFVREAEQLPVYEMSSMSELQEDLVEKAAAIPAEMDNGLAANAKIGRRG